MINPIVQQKRQELLTFIESEVLGEAAVQGIIAIGSIATGAARTDSDIDAVIFLSPFDLYAVPAEFQWCPRDRSFHSIFVEVAGAIQFDFKRLELAEWSKPTFQWPEPLQAELSEGWLAFDRHGDIQTLIDQRIRFTNELRQSRLDEALLQLDQLLTPYKVERVWQTLGPSAAHDRLHAAWGQLEHALFAYNRRWRPWPSRELSYLTQLPWLPDRFNEQLLLALNAPSLDYAGYQQRVAVLTRCFAALVAQLQHDKLYGADAISEAFIRQHNEPGRSWNIQEWTQIHMTR